LKGGFLLMAVSFITVARNGQWKRWFHRFVWKPFAG
jgi:hypothetical protein